MAKIGTIVWRGQSGAKYPFDVYDGFRFTKAAAVYMFTRRAPKSGGNSFEHAPIYVGQTGDLSERFDNHHKYQCIVGKEANAICIHLDDNQPLSEIRAASLGAACLQVPAFRCKLRAAP